MSQPASTQTKKRKKISELTLSQVALSAERIRDIVNALRDETVPPGEGDDPLYAVDPGMLEKLEEIANSLDAKVSGRETYALSSMEDEHLNDLNLSYGPFLEIKEQDLKRRSDLSAQAAPQYAKDFVAQNEAGARTWIDSFFFRANAMLPSDKRMVLSLKQHINVTVQSTDMKGYVDYTTVRATRTVAERFLFLPNLALKGNRDHVGIFVSEAKTQNIQLVQHVPRAVGEMYAWGQTLGRKIVRGALTDGRKWIFLLLKVDEEPGGMYYQSREIAIIVADERVLGERVSKQRCDVVAGILANWIEHSHEDLRADDWFTIPRE